MTYKQQYKIWFVAVVFVLAALFLPEKTEPEVTNQTKYERCVASFEGNPSKISTCNKYKEK